MRYPEILIPLRGNGKSVFSTGENKAFHKIIDANYKRIQSKLAIRNAIVNVHYTIKYF